MGKGRETLVIDRETLSFIVVNAWDRKQGLSVARTGFQWKYVNIAITNSFYIQCSTNRVSRP